MDPVNSKTFELFLKRINHDREVAKVSEVTSEPAVEDNQNFLSTVKRLRAKVILKNGRFANFTFILKDSYTEGDSFQNFIKENGVFKVETMMYDFVLNELENLMEDFEDYDGILWCKLLHYEPYTSLLFEDLQARGFKSLITPCYVDLDHASLALHSLGKYHGMCKVLEQRGKITKENYKEWFVLSNRKTYQIWKDCLNGISDVIRETWDSSWNPIAERLHKLSLIVLENKLNETKNFLLNNSPFKVLNHGDFKISNIMFKYDWRHKPVLIRFLDFQLPTYGSPCMDIVYFLFRSLDPRTRRRNLDQLLECYHRSLISTLKRYNYAGTEPILEEISLGMKRISYLGLLLCLINYIPIRDQQVSESEAPSDYNVKRLIDQYRKPGIDAELGQDLKELIEQLT